jgi:hypothetical protein
MRPSQPRVQRDQGAGDSIPTPIDACQRLPNHPITLHVGRTGAGQWTAAGQAGSVLIYHEGVLTNEAVGTRDGFFIEELWAWRDQWPK